MATMTVLDSVGASQTVEKPLTPGQAARAASRPVTIATEDITALTATQTVSGTVAATQSGTWTVQPGNTANTTAWKFVLDSSQVVALGQAAMTASQPVVIASDQTSVKTISGGNEYETVAVSLTDVILGATGAVGDYIEALICVVATAATSQVQLKDGNGSAMTVLPNAVGAGVGTYYVPLGLRCINATTPGWKITTAAGVTVIATGDFT